MSFGLSNLSLKIQKSIRIPTFKMGPLGSVWVHSLTLFRIPENVYVIHGLHP
jgi:hypothetical protein